jgi:hypothetical protein
MGLLLYPNRLAPGRSQALHNEEADRIAPVSLPYAIPPARNAIHSTTSTLAALSRGRTAIESMLPARESTYKGVPDLNLRAKA